MNIIKNKLTVLPKHDYSLKELTLSGHTSSETAFVGCCGSGPTKSLYLIAYEGIFLADDPMKYWSGKNVTVRVDTFVDIEITIKER